VTKLVCLKALTAVQVQLMALVSRIRRMVLEQAFLLERTSIFWRVFLKVTSLVCELVVSLVIV
jgi:hypothetical protein